MVLNTGNQCQRKLRWSTLKFQNWTSFRATICLCQSDAQILFAAITISRKVFFSKNIMFVESSSTTILLSYVGNKTLFHTGAWKSIGKTCINSLCNLKLCSFPSSPFKVLLASKDLELYLNWDGKHCSAVFEVYQTFKMCFIHSAIPGKSAFNFVQRVGYNQRNFISKHISQYLISINSHPRYWSQLKMEHSTGPHQRSRVWRCW